MVEYIRYTVPNSPGKIKLINHRQVTAINMDESEIKEPNNNCDTATLTPTSETAGTGTKVCNK